MNEYINMVRAHIIEHIEYMQWPVRIEDWQTRCPVLEQWVGMLIEDAHWQRQEAEASLAGVTKERDEAVGHLRNALFGPGEPPPCDCDEDVMHEHILQWNRLSDRARDWLVARDAEKEGK